MQSGDPRPVGGSCDAVRAVSVALLLGRSANPLAPSPSVLPDVHRPLSSNAKAPLPRKCRLQVLLSDARTGMITGVATIFERVNR